MNTQEVQPILYQFASYTRFPRQKLVGTIRKLHSDRPDEEIIAELIEDGWIEEVQVTRSIPFMNDIDYCLTQKARDFLNRRPGDH